MPVEGAGNGSGSGTVPEGDDWKVLQRLFREAEQALSEAETIHSDLAVPSMNQLRYAGHHMLSAMTAETPSEREEEYRKAVRHCQRAVYDAFDSSIAYILKNIDQFKQDYAKVEIVPHFPGYPAIMAEARKARDLLIRARAEKERRQDYYVECREAASRLLGHLKQLEDAREELNKAIRRHNQTVFLGWGGLAAATVAAIAAVAALTI